jgi:Family of unknown function (DUF6765)
MTRSVRIVLVVLALSHMAALAWESDVHYVLTWWLATQAGFSRGDADTIAAADQSYDTSPHHAAVPNMVWILANNDSGAARDLQRKHFPSDARLPSPPMRRVVVPNSQQARIAVESAIRPTNSATALQEFGEGLHPFEDSWSHQGVPDTPLRPALQLRPELGCAHPEARGGWWSHDADYTYLHVEEVKEMARKTYELMSRFLDENPRMREHPAVNWTKLVGIVQEFAVAQTQTQKNAWAVKYVPTSPSQLSMSLTLPGTRSGTGAHAIRPPEGFRAADVPPELVKNANHFAELWITKQDIPQAVETYVELGALGKQWANFPGLDRGRREDITRWSRKFMTMYLVADHGAVNAAGHGNPSSPGYGELPETAIREGRFRALSNLSVAPISSVDFDRVQDFLDGPFALAIQPDGLQHDAAFFVWSNTPGGWRIINMFPIVD